MNSQGKKLGKLKNKYHILDVIEYALCIPDAMYLLWATSKTFR